MNPWTRAVRNAAIASLLTALLPALFALGLGAEGASFMNLLIVYVIFAASCFVPALLIFSPSNPSRKALVILGSGLIFLLVWVILLFAANALR